MIYSHLLRELIILKFALLALPAVFTLPMERGLLTTQQSLPTHTPPLNLCVCVCVFLPVFLSLSLTGVLFHPSLRDAAKLASSLPLRGGMFPCLARGCNSIPPQLHLSPSSLSCGGLLLDEVSECSLQVTPQVPTFCKICPCF